MDQKSSSRLLSTGDNTTTIKANYITADTIGVTFHNLSGCNPKKNGQYIALWQQSGNTIPWNSLPLKVQEIRAETPSGSISFTGLTVTDNSYIIGYAVGPELDNGQKYGNICASVFVPGTDVSGQDDFAPGLTLTFVGSTSVAFGYDLPSGILPLTNTAWAGIWRAGTASYNNPPMASIPVVIDASSGTLAFNKIEIGVGLTYTIALFMSGWSGYGMPGDQTAMACSVTFTDHISQLKEVSIGKSLRDTLESGSSSADSENDFNPEIITKPKGG